MLDSFRSYFTAHQHEGLLNVSSIRPEETFAWALAGAALLFMIYTLQVRRSRRSAAPSYQDIPSKILHHMASRQELEALSGRIDVAIVGSGMGALVCAAILSKCNKVAVFEQHSVVGGSTHTFKTNGYEFDVGVHYIGGCLDSFWSFFRVLFDELTDGQLIFSRTAEKYDVAYNNTTGERIEFTGDPRQNREALLAHFPSCEKAFDKYLRKCRRARSVAYISFALKCLPPCITRLVWKLGFGSLYRRACLGKTLDIMRDCALPDDAIGAITYSYGDYGTSPADSPFFIQAFMQDHYDGGAFFPRGGSASIAKTLVAAILRNGGKVFAATPVEHIITKKTWRGHYKAVGVCVRGVSVFVRMSVISNAGFAKTFEVGRDGSAPLVDQVAGTSQLALVHKKEMAFAFRPSTAFFYLFIGLEGTDKELGLPAQNIWHLSGWNHDASKKKLFDCKDVHESLKDEPPLVFISNESAKDPDYSLRYPGKATSTMIAWTKPEWFEAWRGTTHDHRGEDYETMKADMTAQLLNIFYKHFPQTKGRVAYAELGTPLSANKYLGRTYGEIYNLDHNAERFSSIEAQLALHPETTVQGLFLTGQDVVAVSIEGAALGGLFASARASYLAYIVIGLPLIAAVATLLLAMGLIS